MILICFDGSPGARRAIEQAAHLMPGHPATVVTVWEPRLAENVTEDADVMVGSEESTSRLAATGAELAHEVGVDALSCGVVAHTSIAAAVLAEADRLHADAIVIGSGPQDGLRRGPPGGLADALMHLADRPVLVVPPPAQARSVGAPA